LGIDEPKIKNRKNMNELFSMISLTYMAKKNYNLKQKK